jgi:hypothetical protein
MIQLLGIKEFGQPAKVGFNCEPLVPAATFTVPQIARRRTPLAQALIYQRNRLSVVAQCQVAKHVIQCVGRVPGPINHLAAVGHQPGQLDSHDPAPVRDALLANLLLAAPSRRGWISSMPNGSGW